jgi:1-acyl-sn-glycerol-3-phosphate acyltransferase
VIPAAKSPFFEAWFGRHVASRLRASFASFRLAGADHVRRAVSERPVLLVANHTSFWDPLVGFHLSRFFALDGHAMMDAKNLRRLPFFAKIGAFGVDLDEPRDGARALRYAARLLDRPGRMVLVFPQGRERPITARPLDFRPGSGELSRLCRRAATIPYAVRYEMGADEKPVIWAKIQPELPAFRRADEARAAQEASVTEALDAIDRTLITGDDEDAFTPLFSTPRAVDSLATQALAFLTR